MPSYEHDLFISYASIDDEPVHGGPLGWVTALGKHVEKLLSILLGKKARVWMDHGLSGNVGLTEQLMGAVRRSATLLVVLSPGYTASAWCRRELNAFLDSFRERVATSIFVVEFVPVDDDARPQEFWDLRGFRFWRKNTKGALTLLGMFGTDEEYFGVLQDLCHDLTAELKKIRPKEGRTLPPSGNGARKTVYLAEVTDDLESRRSELRRYVEQAGARVVPVVGCYPRSPDKFEEAARRDLSDSDFFVQLLSDTLGVRGPDLPGGYGGLQFDLARELSKPIFQWRAPEVRLDEVLDVVHKKLLKGASVRAEGIEDFKGFLREQLSQEPTPQSRAPGRASQAGSLGRAASKLVFLDSDQSDEGFRGHVRELVMRYGAGVVEPLRSQDPAENRRDLESNLKDCDIVVLLYGAGATTWVRSRLRECRKIQANRTQPFDALAVVEGPPEMKVPLDINFDGMKILNWRKGPVETDLRQLLRPS